MRNAVVAQTCSEKPFRSSAMVLIAVETTVWSRAARNIPIIRPTRIVRISRWLKPSAADPPARASWRVDVAAIRVPGLRVGAGGGTGQGRPVARPPQVDSTSRLSRRSSLADGTVVLDEQL